MSSWAMIVRLAVFVSLVFCSSMVVGAPKLVVKTDYLEMHTGAGRGFPVINVVEKDQVFEPVNRKTDWIKIVTNDGSEGWVSYDEFLLATRLKRSDFRKRAAQASWQLGIRGGLFDVDPLYSVFASYYPLHSLGLNLEAGKVAGNFASSDFYSVGMKVLMFRGARLTPGLNIATGILHYSPHGVLVNARSEQYTYWDIGGGVLYLPYKRLGLELKLNNTTITDFNSYWSATFAVSAFFN